MIEFTLDDFKEIPEGFAGIYYDMPMNEYRKAEGLSNSELQLFDRNPSSYVWSRTAPVDPKKALTSELGTALHTATLEPEKLKGSTIVSDYKGRQSEGFRKFQNEHKDKIAVTESEYVEINNITESAKCDPMFSKMLSANGHVESSIFVTCPETGLKLKIRPDKIITRNDHDPLLADLKSTATLDEWRSDRTWINPLFKFGYGFTAAYYIHVASIHFGVEIKKYCFMVISKTAVMGKYPVSVFVITKQELIDYGFWDQMLNAIRDFKQRSDTNNFISYEKFPKFYIEDFGEVEIKFEE